MQRNGYIRSALQVEMGLPKVRRGTCAKGARELFLPFPFIAFPSKPLMSVTKKLGELRSRTIVCLLDLFGLSITAIGPF